MKRQLRDEWVAKLRDPESKQTQGCLENCNGNCCLGVLANLCKVRKIVTVYGESHYMFNNEYESVALPPHGWNGLSNDTMTILSILNDGSIKYLDQPRKTFSEIADWIEANIPVED